LEGELAQNVSGDVIDEDQKKGDATEKVEPKVAHPCDPWGRHVDARLDDRPIGCFQDCRAKLHNSSSARRVHRRIGPGMDKDTTV
jgi:hypothetical protein